MTTQLREWKAIDADRYYWDLLEDGNFSRAVYGYYAETHEVYWWDQEPGKFLRREDTLHDARTFVQEQYPGIEIVPGNA